MLNLEKTSVFSYLKSWQVGELRLLVGLQQADPRPPSKEAVCVLPGGEKDPQAFGC